MALSMMAIESYFLKTNTTEYLNPSNSNTLSNAIEDYRVIAPDLSN